MTAMELTGGSYEELFNLGNYNNRKLHLDFVLAAGDDPAVVLDQVRKIVQDEARAMKRASAIDEAQYTLAHSAEFPAYEVERARKSLITYGVLPPEPTVAPDDPPF
jgi:hypothetical protein